MTVSSPPPPPGQKQGLSTLAKVGIGCVVLLVIAAICAGLAVRACAHYAKSKLGDFEKNPAYAGLKLAVQVNPQLEIQSEDEKAGTITVKNKETGEVITLDTSSYKDGKITIQGKDGKANIDINGGPNGGIKVTNDKGESTFQMGGGEVKNLPSWVPSYPGATVQGTFDSTSNGNRSLAYTVKSSDGVDKLMAFYESKLKDAGLKVEKTTFSANGTSGGSVTGKSDDGNRSLTAMISAETDGAQALITVEEKH